MSFKKILSFLTGTSILLLFFVAGAAAQPASNPRQFPPGALQRIEDLPASAFRTKLQNLPPAAQARARSWLQGFHFTELDLESLDTDPEGGIFYVDHFTHDLPLEAPGESDPAIAQAAVPVSPLPASLIFHSRPGAPNVIFLNFTGETVTNTAWNTTSRSVIPAVAFSTDSDFSTFSDAEQVAIKRIWQRVAEDFAPFNVNVTTERPATFTTRTAHALITRSTDANGVNNPSSSGGGVAYVNVFGTSTYAKYRPAWIYYNNLSNSESLVAEATSHEIGHNLGLSHDGQTNGTEYYGGHGIGDTSWGPIMGTGYNRNVSQWCKGEYHLASNTQDDLATIAGKIPYLSDDHGNSASSATPLAVTGTNILSSTPEADPGNLNPANKGILERSGDVDVFSFTTGNGPVRLIVNPWISPSGRRGGNLDVSIALYNQSGQLLLTNNSPTLTTAQIDATLSTGTYFLHVQNSGTGDPMSATPTGYTAYGSLGQYFVSGYITRPDSAPPAVQFAASSSNPSWGSVTPSDITLAAGSTLQIVAAPESYYRFVNWSGDLTGTNAQTTLTVQSNMSVMAHFAEIVTTNHSVPHWWLAASGITNQFESAVTSIGANGLPFWQSYVAGVNPLDPNSRPSVAARPASDGTSLTLQWSTVSGRTYTLLHSTNALSGFTPVPSALRLPSSVTSHSVPIDPAVPARFYRIEIQRE